MRVLRILAPLLTVAALATACGNGSSSESADSSTGPATGPATSSTLQLRLISARYTQNPAKGQEQLGPPAPKDMVETMKNYDCSSAPTEVNGELLECDATSNVFLLQAPLVTGGVSSAEPRSIEHGKQWFIKVQFDDAATATLANTVKSAPGSDLALVLDGKVVTAVLVQDSLTDGSLGITGDFDKASATALAQALTA